jgi:hypothetical protein
VSCHSQYHRLWCYHTECFCGPLTAAAALSLGRPPCSGHVSAMKIAETGVASAARAGRVLSESTSAGKLAASVVGLIMLAIVAWRFPELVGVSSLSCLRLSLVRVQMSPLYLGPRMAVLYTLAASQACLKEERFQTLKIYYKYSSKERLCKEH